MRKTGIDILGDFPWGTHFCQFYQTPQDLTEILVPYFRAGLEGNEFCMWITSPPLGKEEAEAALRQSVPGFGCYKQKGQIEILPHSEWYLRGGAFDLQRVLNGWLAKLEQALAGGFDGMRVTGNTAWLEKRDWKSFTDYEEAINAVVGKHRFITLCSYFLEKCGALEILDVIRNHQFALIKSDKGWEVIESSGLKHAREMQRVSEERYSALVELAPDAIVVHRDGRFLYANSAALRLYGAETLDQLRAKLVFDLIHPDDRESVKARMQRLAAGGATPLEEHRILRLDGTVVPVETIGGRVDYQGQSAVQLIIRDVTERRQAEAALRESETRLREQTELLDLADVLARDMGDRIILWNRGAERLYGWSKAEALGSVSHERFQTVFTQPLQEIKDTLFREGSWEGELVHTRKDGKRITVASHWTLHRNESGQPVAILEADTDITGLKRAEEALQKANEELEQRVAERTAELRVASQYSRSLIEASLDPLVTISPEGRITDVNRATELATGVTRERLIGSSFSDYFTEPEKAHEGYRKVIAEGLVRDYPLTIRHASGRTTDVLYNATVYRNEAGQMQGVFAAARDITERIAMERVLQDSEARYRSLVTASAQMVWTTNAQGEVVEDIPSWRAFTGQDLEEVIGWGWAEAVHTEDRERTRAAWIRSVEIHTSYETEYRVRRHDGEYRHFAVRGVPVLENGGRVREWVGACTDITEIKEAERRRNLARALLELFARKGSSKEYLDSVVEVIQAWSGCQALGIRIVDENGYIPYASCVGFPPEFLQLENMLSLSANSCCCVRAINQVVEDQDRALLTSGGSFCCDNTSEFIDHLPAAQQARYRGNCIKFGFLSLGVIPIRYREQVLGAIHLADRREALFTLATVEFLESMAPLIGEAIRRFRAEAELSRYRDHLEELVKQRTAELEAANARLQMEIAERQRTEETLRRTAEELARSNHDLEQFAYAASHDLQEPLRAVAGYVELLKHRYVDKLDAKALQFIAGAADGAVRMQGLITDLLAFSRVGTQGKGFEMTDIKTVLDTALASLKVGIKEARAKITSDPLPVLRVDAMQVAQLLQNLIGNAIKFRSERQPEIHIGAKEQPGQWVFSVRDNGIGIDPQYADRIFLIFQRLHTRRRYPGTGIGLAICKRIVERHGGTIWVESQPEQGSTFYFTIPAREEHFQ